MCESDLFAMTGCSRQGQHKLSKEAWAFSVLLFKMQVTSLQTCIWVVSRDKCRSKAIQADKSLTHLSSLLGWYTSRITEAFEIKNGQRKDKREFYKMSSLIQQHFKSPTAVLFNFGEWDFK